MKHLKSILVFILITALCASLFTVAYAKHGGGEEDDKNVKNSVLSNDVKTLVDLGLLVGTGKDGVTYEYSKSKPTRIQAFIVYLRLTNQLNIFEQFTYHHGDKNFDDHDGYSEWVQKGMAFAKANPQYNWVGYNGKFNPMAHLTAREYAKVLLTILGYKDFTWATVESYAEKIGLDVPEGAFTFEEFATMTVQALKLMGKILPDPDKTPPTVTDLVLSTPYKEGPPVVYGQVIMYFSEAMNKDTLKNLSNYLIDLDGVPGTPGQSLSQIKHSDAVPASDGKSVTLIITDIALKGGITKITPSGLTDFVGNLIVPDTNTKTVRIPDALTAQVPVAIAENELQITFNNPMRPDNTAGDFKVYAADGATLISYGTHYTLDSSDKVVTITLNGILTADAMDPVTKTAAWLTIGTNTKDIFGQAVSGIFAASAKVKIDDKIAPSVVSCVKGAVPYTFEMTFTEPVNAVDLSKLKITNMSGTVQTATYAYNSSNPTNFTKLTVTITNPVASENRYNIELQSQGIKDLSNNFVIAYTKTLTVATAVQP